jgi:hypothetical protein
LKPDRMLTIRRCSSVAIKGWIRHLMSPCKSSGVLSAVLFPETLVDIAAMCNQFKSAGVCVELDIVNYSRTRQMRS